MSRKLTALFILGAVCASAQFQPNSLRDRAWSAWKAGSSHDAAHVGPLLDQLTQAIPLANAVSGTEEYALVETLFDALIQLDADIPADLILPFEHQWRSEVLILLSRSKIDAVAENALLDMRDHPMSEPEWTAVNDLLFAASSLPFFQRTLGDVRVSHRFVVTDPDTGVGWSSCSAGVGCGSVPTGAPADFPPAADYRLSVAMKPGDKMLAAQPIALYYRRITAQGCPDPPVAAVTRQILSTRFLSAVAGVSAEDSEELFSPMSLIVTAPEIESLLATQTTAIQAMITAAQQSGWVQASGMRLPIEVTIEDMRSDRSKPLPNILPHEIVIP